MQTNLGIIKSPYVIAFCDLFDHTITMQSVDATNPLDAMVTFLGEHDRVPEDMIFDSIEEIKEFCFNGDCVIEVYAI